MSHGTCPAGGKWYECTTGSNFFGCCTSDPCNSKGCPAADLKPAGLGTAPGPASDTTKNPNGSWYQYEQCSAGQWYTCADISPSFQGCCDIINPCANKGCPSNNLHAASFKSIPPELKSSTTSTSTTPSTTIKTTTSNTATPTSTPATTTSATHTPTSTPAPAEKSSNTAIIAGAAIAGVALIGIIIAAFFLYRRRRRNQQKNRNSGGAAGLVVPTPFTPKPYDADKLTQAFPSPAENRPESLGMKKPTLPDVEINPYKPIHHAEHAAPLFSPPLPHQSRHSPTPSMSKSANLHSPNPYTDQTPPSSAGLGLPAYAHNNPNNLGVGVIAGGGRRISSGGYEEIPQLDSTEISSVPNSRHPSRANSPGPVEMPDTSLGGGGSGANTPRFGSSMVSAESPVIGRGGLGMGGVGNGGRGVSAVSGVSELSSQNSASGTNLREGYTSWQSLEPPR